MSLNIANNYRAKIRGRSDAILPSLIIDNATAAIEFYKKVFNAQLMYLSEYNGKVVHAELLIGSSTIMLSDEFPWAKSAKTIGDTPIVLYTYVDNVDDTFKKAIDNGAKVDHAPEDAFYGDRMGSFIDPFNFRWVVAKHIRDVPNEEILAEQEKMFSTPKVKGGSNADYYKKYLKYKIKYDQLKF